MTTGCTPHAPLLSGYEQPEEAVVEDLLGTLDDPALPLLQWSGALSTVAARLPPDLADHLQALLGRHRRPSLEANVPCRSSDAACLPFARIGVQTVTGRESLHCAGCLDRLR